MNEDQKRQLKENGFIDPLFISLSIRTTCSSCNTGIPLNGPQRQVKCPNCLIEFCVKERTWKSVLESPFEYHSKYGGKGGWRLLDGTLHGKWKVQNPRCPKCKEEIPERYTAVGIKEKWSCGSCGNKMSTFAAPEWMRKIFNNAVQLYCAERERSKSPDAVSATVQEGVNPVAFTCPTCSGGLTVTSSSDRTIACEHCGNSVYLPDGLWLQLHPAKHIKQWFVRYDRDDGPSPSPDKEQFVRCADHGLLYDPAKSSGCTRCK